jgi:hypothetical protein
MKYLLLIPIAIGAYILWTFYRDRRANQHLDLAFLKEISPILDDLEAGKKIDATILENICKNNANRFLFSRYLKDLNRLEVLPPKYRNQVSGAMASLCFLLRDVKILGANPDEIELIDSISFPSPTTEIDVVYHVFRFKMNAPHWAAASGWRVGVAGPYYPNTPDYAMAFGTFSRLDPLNDMTIENHARWVHENKVIKKGFFELG